MKFGTIVYDKLTIGYEWIVICRSIVISMETVRKFMKLCPTYLTFSLQNQHNNFFTK